VAASKTKNPATPPLDFNEMDDLRQGVEANQKHCQREAAWAEEIVPEVTERAMRSFASREVSSTIVALGRRLEQIRSEQLERYDSKIRTLEPAQRGAVEALIKGILNKILHGPVCELNAHAGTQEQHALVQLVGRIFGLGQ
jgi:glutamyl-tRNA reductase